jgi:hypothetical protein
MIDERPVTLLLYPDRPIEGRIVALTEDLIQRSIRTAWWTDPNLKAGHSPQIDRFWNWSNRQVDVDGVMVPCERVALVTGDVHDCFVEGGMIVTSEAVPSILASTSKCLHVEYLFTAPRNRPAIRGDGKPFVIGVGSQLLRWAAFSAVRRGSPAVYASIRAPISLDGTRNADCKSSMRLLSYLRMSLTRQWS